MIEACAKETGAILHQMSNASEEGLSELKIEACDKLMGAVLIVWTLPGVVWALI